MKKSIIAALALASSLAHAQPVGQNAGMLADAAGRTLYIFTQDGPGKSTCSGSCAAAWPPFRVKPGESTRAGFSSIERDDGARQWAMDGKPLYYFAADAQPGDAKGDGQGGVWFVVREGAKRAQAAPTSGSRGASSYY